MKRLFSSLIIAMLCISAAWGQSSRCQDPTGLNVTDVTRTSATLGWGLGEGTQAPATYILTVTDDDGDTVIYNPALTATGLSTQLTNLTANTVYHVTLQGDCSADYAGMSGTGTLTFTTMCHPLPLPWASNFDALTSAPDCMQSSNATFTSDAIKLKSTASESAFVMFPLMSADVDKLEIDFSVHRGSNSSNVSYEIGVVTDPSQLISTYVPLISDTATSTAWVNKRINTSLAYTMWGMTDSAAAICIFIPSGTNGEMWIDNVNIHSKPGCLRVENVNIEDYDINSVTVSFETGGSNSFTIKCKSAVDSIITTATTSPATVTGLSPDKNYVVTVMRNCGSNMSEPSVAASFRTLCAMAQSPLMYEDFSRDTLPYCWQEGTNWFCTEKLPLQAGTHDINIRISREADDADVNKGIEIWLTNKAGVTAGATRIAKIPFYFGTSPVEETSGWYDYSYTINTTGNYYIMVKGESKDESNQWRLQELSVTPVPTCREIAGIGKPTSTQTSITLPWAAGGSETGWVLTYIITDGTRVISQDSTLVSQPSFTFQGLTLGTEYTITGAIYARCSATDMSERYDFEIKKQTKCLSKSVPYSENFEAFNAGSTPLCWDGEKWLVATNTVNQATNNVLKLNNQEQLTGTAIIYSPVVTLIQGEEYVVRFDWMNTMSRSASADYIPTVLKISTNNGVSFSTVDTLPCDIANADNLEYEITQWAGNDVIIAFESETSHNYGMAMIDNFQIARKPTCADLKKVSVSSIMTNSAVITVADSLATDWEVTWGGVGSQPGSSNVIAVNGATSYTITNLSAQTSYDVYVRRVCSATDKGDWSRKPISFQTTCTASALPVEENFESMASGILAGCFVHNTVNSFQYGVTASSAYNHTTGGIKGIVSSSTAVSVNPTSAQAEEVSTPLEAFRYVSLEAGKNYEVSMWLKNGESSSSENYDYQITFTCGVQMENMTVIGGDIVTDGTWKRSRHYFTVPADGNYFIGFKTEAYNTRSYKFIADDYQIREVGCIPPMGIMVSQRTTNSATITFSGSASSYEIVVPGVMHDTAFVGNVVNLTGLAANTEYTFTIRSKCSGGTSEWSDDITFRTRCGGADMPYHETFERAASADCWSSFGSGVAMRVNNQSHNGNASFKASSKTVILPEMDVTSLANYLMNGWVYSTSSTYMAYGVMTDPDDMSTYEELGSIFVTRAYNWTEFEAGFDSLNSPSYSEFANARYIVLVVPEGVEAYFDDIDIDLTPTCRKPQNITCSNTTSSSITVTWSQSGNPSQWEVSAIPTTSKGFIQSRTTTARTVVFNGLTAGTEYRFEIRSICGAGDTSAVATSDVSSTLCGTMTAPMAEGFEDYEIGLAPSCWNIQCTSLNVLAHNLWCVMGQGDNHYVRARTSWIQRGETVEMTSQGITLASGKQWELSLDYAHQATCGPMEVYLKRTTDSQFTLLGTLAKDGTTDEQTPNSWKTATYNISSYAGKSVMIKLVCTGDYANGAVFVDNINITEIRSCEDVQAVNVTAGVTEANVTFTDTLASHTAWQWVAGRKGINPDQATIHNTTTKSFQISGLTSATQYDVYVRAVCGTNDYSNWVRAQYVTISNPAPMPYYCDFSDEDENSLWGIANSEDAGSIFAIGNCSTAVKSGTRALYVSTDGGTTYSYNLNQEGTTVAYRLFSFETGRYQFEFDWQCPGGHIETPYDYARIYLQPANRSVDIAQSGYYYDRYYPQDIIPLDGGTPFAQVHGGWQMTNATLDMTGREGYYYLVFVWSNNDSYGTPEYPLSVNDVRVRKLSCTSVSNVTIASKTGSSVTARVRGGQNIKWAINNENSLDGVLQNGTGLNDSTIVVSNLEPSTKYWLFVSNTCSDNTQSEWKVTEFTTDCGVISSYPYLEDFNGSVFPPICWSIDGNGTWERYVSNYDDSQAHSGTAASLEGSTGTTTRLVSPAMHFDASRDYRLSFWMSRTTAQWITDDMSVLISPNPTGTTGAKSLGTWATFHSTLDEVVQISCDIPSTLPTGDYYIMFEGHHRSNYVIIDDIEVTEYAACREIEGAPALLNVSMNSVTVAIEKGKRDTIEFGYAVGNGTTAALAGSVKSTTGIAQITGLAAGSVYTIYARALCSNHDTTAWTSGINVTTKSSDCYEPYNLRIVGSAGSTDVTLTWGGAPNATQYEYELMSAVDTVRGITTSDTIYITGLSARKPYTARVRCLCSDSSNTVWSTLTFSTTQIIATAPYFTGFEDAVDNAQWDYIHSVAYRNKFCMGTKMKKSGSRSLYVSNNSTAYQITLPSNGAYAAINVGYAKRLAHFEPGVYEVSFDWRCDAYNQTVNAPVWRAFGRAFLLPEGGELAPDVITYYSAAPSNAIEIYPGEMEKHSSWTHHKTFIEIEEEGNYDIVFGWFGQNTGRGASKADVGNSPLAIDNLSIEEVTCMPVNSFSVVSRKHNEVKVKVNRPSNTPVEWTLLDVNEEDSITTWTSQPGDTITLTSIQPRQKYYLFARMACDTANKSPWQEVDILVPAEAATLPYVCNFEDTTEAMNWMFAQESQYHRFIWGTGANNGGTHSMYVTDNTANHYVDYNGSGNIKSSSYVYRLFHLTPGVYEWAYDWRCKGEITHINDYGRALLIPQSVNLTGGTTLSGLSASSTPSNCKALEDDGALYNQGTWKSSQGLVTITREDDYNLTFFWTNDASAGEDPPLAVDNVSLREVFCLPATISVSNLTQNSMQLTFTKDDASAPLFYTISTRDSHDAADVLISDTTNLTSVTVNGLNASNTYYIHARVLCSVEESPWSKTSARTSCGIVQGLPYEMDFEMLNTTSSGVNNALSQVCWSAQGLGAVAMGGSNSYPYYAVSSDTNYMHSGKRCLRLFSASDTNYMYLILPEFAERSNLRMYFWYCNWYSGTDNITVGYMQSDNTFIPLTVLRRVTGMTYAHQDFPTLPSGSRLAFRHGGGGNNGYGGLDDIRVIKLIDGGTIQDTICYNSDYTANGFNVQASAMTVGVNSLSRTSISENATDMDTVYHADVYMRPQASSNDYDTICAGVPYVKGDFVIANPQSRQYFIPLAGQSHTGCDSIVSLWLHVIPSRHTVFDTICQGDVYSFGGQQLTVTGDYVDYRTGERGCADTVTLHLLVIDSVENVSATICNGDAYPFEGQQYYNSGTYRIPVTSSHGCTITKILHLTVLSTDTTYSVTICQGGQYLVGDSVITTAGTYTVTRMSRAGCNVTHRVTVAVTPAKQGNVSDYVCENQTYSGYGIHNLVVTNDTVVYVNTKDADMCDSIGVVSIRVEPIRRSTEYKRIAEGDSYTWNNNTYTKSGTYDAYLTSVETGCDSIATLVLTVGTGVENTSSQSELKVYPNPTTGIVYLAVKEDVDIEVRDLTGRVVMRTRGTMVDLSGMAEGIYFVNRIRVILKK